MNDEEVAFRIVRLYFEDVARLGFKRQLDLDQMINAYFYTLKMLKNKDESVKKIVAELKKAESKDKEVSYKSVETKTTISQETVPVVKETTTVTTSTVPLQKEKSVTEILEEK